MIDRIKAGLHQTGFKIDAGIAAFGGAFIAKADSIEIALRILGSLLLCALLAARIYFVIKNKGKDPEGEP